MAEATDAILALCRALPPTRAAVVHPVKPNVIEAVDEAVREKLIVPILIGPKAKIEEAATVASVDISGWELVDVEHSHAAAAKAAELAAGHQVDAIMKGSLHTDELLGAVVRSDAGLRTERRISHAYLMSIASYPKPFIITDAAVNILPDLPVKADIVQNAADLWRVVFGDGNLPKVAVLAAVETVNPKMQATLDAAALCKMADRGQITGCLIDGPLAFDNAISAEAAREKAVPFLHEVALGHVAVAALWRYVVGVADRALGLVVCHRAHLVAPCGIGDGHGSDQAGYRGAEGR